MSQDSFDPQRIIADPSASATDAEAVLAAGVARVVEGLYSILGEMGRSKRGSVVYLARDLATQRLIALKLSQSPPASNEYTLEVCETLDASIPGLESSCPDCRSPLPDWGRYCYRCGADLGGGPGADEVEAIAALVAEVTRSTAAEYNLLGYMPRDEGGGVVFFGTERATGRLVGLRIRREETAEGQPAGYSISRSSVLKRIAGQAGRTDVTGVRRAAPEPDAAPAKPTDRSDAGWIDRAASITSRWYRRWKGA